MELLETQDPEKKKLIETSEWHKHEIEREVREITDKTESVLKNALIIGGVLAATYLIVSSLSSSSKKKKRKKEKSNPGGDSLAESINAEEHNVYSPPSFLSQLGERVAAQATVLLLDIAKEKLADYLSKRSDSNENPS
jgi:hypothetical protein